MNRKLVLSAVAIAGVVALPAVAQTMMRHAPDQTVTRAQVEADVKETFDKVDANHDGFITREEAQTFRQGARAKIHDAMFARLDSDKDGSISRSEFDAPRGKLADASAKPDAPKHRMGGGMHRGPGMAMGTGLGGGMLFDRADINKDGKLSLAEAEALPLQMFDRADTNRDGSVTPDERKAAREAIRNRWKQRQG